MNGSHYDRLSPLDNSFLVFENEQSAIHVASTQIHESEPLQKADGSLDIERIQEYVLSRLHLIPRYRQKLATTPLAGHPVWVDDPDFNILYHVRHARLPHPGDARQLKRMIGRIFSQHLDRGKPLWELWVIEGLEGNHFAICGKVHHCVVDGVSGSELIATLLTAAPQSKVESPRVWQARPAPSRLELGLDDLGRAVRAPFRAGSALAGLAIDRDDVRHSLAERARAIERMIGDFGVVTPVPFNQPVGPYRRIDWLTMSLDRLRAVRRAVGGTVNDVVLATATGAIARFLSRSRGMDLADLRFRVLAPVSTREPKEQSALGNRISAWVLELPLSVRDPIQCLEQIARQTEEYKSSKRALGAEAITQVAEWGGTALLSLGSRIMNYGSPFNTVITNVPGPRVPLYLLESRLVEIHPHMPLVGTLGLGIALFSYAGTLSWGFTADWDLLPDLHDFTRYTESSFSALERAVGL